MTVGYLYVTGYEGHLCLLGNDILRNHSTHKFLGLLNKDDGAHLQLQDVARDKIIYVKCTSAPCSGS